ncbi:MAG TPA: heparan-alpha-glucosaminide N-acetyltransferase domain-containing protein [Candidatus Polarisedimenticolaceae bacterium]|nr:heparan-alpha-glucosaminide N-acetyltransferase domain-containing protein [Candidatus Polarisedimenticolaceae bacterium]
MEPGRNRSPSAVARVASLDLVRGVVMVLMAIDHVRVYAGVPAGAPTPGVFFTRWITHFVAPGFAFFAGTSAYLHGRKLGNRNALARFLLTRGAWLVLLELTVLRVAWTFNFDFAHYMLAGVIWMLGWCMILLAGAIYLPTPVVGAIGVAIIVLHNLIPASGTHALLKILYLGGAVDLGFAPLLVLYVLVPWIGVMMAGYAFGTVMTRPTGQRRALCLRLGMAVTLTFLALRALDLYGDPRPWHAQDGIPAPLAFINTTKYPASLSFLLMTLGPLLILLAFAEGWHGRVARWLETFGRVPLFYYLLHIPLIHVAACVVSLIREGAVNPWLFGNHPLAPPEVPEGYRWSLPLLYLVWAVCVAALYFPCRWFADLRARRRSRWLSYL